MYFLSVILSASRYDLFHDFHSLIFDFFEDYLFSVQHRLQYFHQGAILLSFNSIQWQFNPPDPFLLNSTEKERLNPLISIMFKQVNLTDTSFSPSVWFLLGR